MNTKEKRSLLAFMIAIMESSMLMTASLIESRWLFAVMGLVFLAIAGAIGIYFISIDRKVA